jgi:transcriptional regulator with XRE-family HTH domain
MTVGERIKDLRGQKKLTQTELAKLVGLSYIQVGRYETNKSNPSADVLQRVASALDTTTDYLMKGTEDEAVAAQLTDKELLKQFKQVEQLNQEDKHLIKTFIDAFLTKRADSATGRLTATVWAQKKPQR